jgi:hypothetical protein
MKDDTQLIQLGSIVGAAVHSLITEDMDMLTAEWLQVKIEWGLGKFIVLFGGIDSAVEHFVKFHSDSIPYIRRFISTKHPNHLERFDKLSLLT